jgi:hypothetical protein
MQVCQIIEEEWHESYLEMCRADQEYYTIPVPSPLPPVLDTETPIY